MRIVEALARGGMAELFLARRGAHEMVLKRPFRGAPRADDFWHEVLVTEAVQHPNVVEYVGFERIQGRGSLLLKRVDGPDLQTLRESLRDHGRRPSPTLSAFVVAEAAAGLHAAHTAKSGDLFLDVVHCDVSMCNIAISKRGEVKVIDFGAARSVLLADQPGTVTGKLSYIAPERWAGRAFDCRADVFSLGVVLWELLCGRRLDARSGPAPSPCTLVPDADARLCNITLKALSRNPEDRHPSAEALSQELLFWVRSQRDGMGCGMLSATIERLQEDAFPLGLEPTRIARAPRTAA